jgi:hypothetical protein
MPDPVHQPQADPKDDKRTSGADAGEPRDPGDDKAARALEKIEDLRRKLEPRG